MGCVGCVLSLFIAVGCPPAVDDPGSWDDDDDGDDDVDEDQDQDGDGWTVAEGDCDDSSDQIHPQATEACNGIDDDCDGTLPEDEVDGDGDGYLSCAECDDTDAAVNPGATEACNGIDDDCDGTIDEPDAVDASTWYADADGDTFGDPDVTQPSCDPPTGYVDDYTDCDDCDASVNPAAEDSYGDGIDQDCDGWTDEIYVCQDGTGDYELPSEAVSAAAEGDTIEICPGTYEDTIEMPYVSLTIVGSSGDPDDVLVDASSYDYGIYGEAYGGGGYYDETWLIEAISIVGGTHGAVVLASTEDGGEVHFRNITVLDTYMIPRDGGFDALFWVVGYNDVILENALFVNNGTEESDLWGCGVYFIVVQSSDGSARVQNVAIVGNGLDPGASCWGNLVYVWGDTGHEISNSIISDNIALRAIHAACPCVGSDYIINNTIVDNVLGESVVYYSDDPLNYGTAPIRVWLSQNPLISLWFDPPERACLGGLGRSRCR
jgi:hypothetical protein